MAIFDTIALFLIFAGFVIGLGAVTVIDLHGFLGRKSSYWTEATIRTHKVTKPLIWTGTFLVIGAGTYFYWTEALRGIPLFHAIAFGVLILNGCFLSFYISPYLLRQEREGRSSELLPRHIQQLITVSFVISFTLWWSSLFLLIFYLTR